MSNAKANFKLFLWNKEAESVSDLDIFSRMSQWNFPGEITSRLHDLLKASIKFTGKVLRIGKIVILKVLEFVENNPGLVAGLGVGVVLGGALAGFLASIHAPVLLGFLNPLITPITTALGSFAQFALPIVGGGLGNFLDRNAPEMGKSVVDTAKKFFKLFADILDAVFGELSKDEVQMAW